MVNGKFIPGFGTQLYQIFKTSVGSPAFDTRTDFRILSDFSHEIHCIINSHEFPFLSVDDH
jgi:hypothetical protein